MNKLRSAIIIALFLLLLAIAGHMDFMTAVQTGAAVDANGKQLTMQDATWFCDNF